MSAVGYASEHASALEDVRAAGADVVWTWETSVHDPATGGFAPPVVHTVPGAALRVKGKPLTYQKLGLIESEAPTLFFVPDAKGDLPDLTATVVFGGLTYGIADCDPFDPDGEGAVFARIVVRR